MDSPYLDVQIMAMVDENGRSFFAGEDNGDSGAEQQFFSRKTSNSCVIMSKEVLTAIGQPLSNRVNMVITSEQDHEAPDYMVAENFSEAIRTARMFPSIYVVGGSELYQESFDYANTLWLLKSKARHAVGEDFLKVPSHYELEATDELENGMVVERWVNPDRIVKLYKAPKRH